MEEQAPDSPARAMTKETRRLLETFICIIPQRSAPSNYRALIAASPIRARQPIVARAESWQLIQRVFEPGQRQRDADALFGGLKDDESRGFAILHLIKELVVHDDFGDAAVGETAHEGRPADVDLIDFQTKARRDQHA